jgi:hypothetical protein
LKRRREPIFPTSASPELSPMRWRIAVPNAAVTRSSAPSEAEHRSAARTALVA